MVDRSSLAGLLQPMPCLKLRPQRKATLALGSALAAYSGLLVRSRAWQGLPASPAVPVIWSWRRLARTRLVYQRCMLTFTWMAIKPGARECTCIYKRLLRGKAQLQVAEVAGVHRPPGTRACPVHHLLHGEIGLTLAMSGQVYVTLKGGRFIVSVSCLLCSSAMPGVWSFLRVKLKGGHSSTCQSHGHGNCHEK